MSFRIKSTDSMTTVRLKALYLVPMLLILFIPLMLWVGWQREGKSTLLDIITLLKGGRP
jgi:hypothetical protein